MDTRKKRTNSTGSKPPAPRRKPAENKTAPRSKASAAPGRNISRTAVRKTPAASKNRNRAASPETKASASAAPEVVYTPAAPFSRGRLLLRLATIVAVVLAITFGISIFFKVDEIRVSGNEKYDAWAIREASGIQIGDSLLTFGKTKAGGKIIANLPYVKNARIGIKLPGTVNIVIEEMEAVYSIRDTANAWWLVSAEGVVIEQTDLATAGEHTKLLGVALNLPQPGQKAVAAETIGGEQTPEGEDAPVTIYGYERLAAALSIAQYLEDNGIVGKVVSIDVGDMGNIELWYGKQYHVLFGNSTRLYDKVSYMRQCIAALEDFESGVLDLSLTLRGDQPVYKSFLDDPQ